jgi:Leucine-rich repeat (LRR) protein
MEFTNSILDIFSALPKLTRANLSRNLLGSTEGIAVPKRLPFPRLNFLELTDTKLEWPDLQNIGKWFPFIKHLQVCCNSLSCLCSEALVYFQHLETLLLNGNHIEDWNQVWKLSSLPRLETLVLSGNPLGSISYNKLNPLLPDFVPR